MQIRASALVREAAEGEVIVIERRGTPIAELRSLSAKKHRKPFPNIDRFLAKLPKVSGDSGRFLEEDR